MRVIACVAVALALLGSVSAEAQNETLLTVDNFNDMTSGMNVFLKFFVPWCPHSRQLAPAWRELTGEFFGHKTVLVAEVNCSSKRSKWLCDTNEIMKYPTLLYGDVSDLKQYRASRLSEELSDFVRHHLVPLDPPPKIDGPLVKKPKAKTGMDLYLTMSVETLESEIATAEERRKEIADNYREKMLVLLEQENAARAALQTSFTDAEKKKHGKEVVKFQLLGMEWNQESHEYREENEEALKQLSKALKAKKKEQLEQQTDKYDEL